MIMKSSFPVFVSQNTRSREESLRIEFLFKNRIWKGDDSSDFERCGQIILEQVKLKKCILQLRYYN